MNRVSNKQIAVVFFLGALITAAVFALVITYAGYLPTIASIPLHKSDSGLGELFYRIARNSFFISGTSGLILGLALPAIFRIYKQRFGSSAEPEATEGESQWCLIGNIVDERPSGEGGEVIKHGTKHFSPGTKIYAFPAQWGDGYEKIIVVGRHRGSKDFVTMVIQSDWVTNWRAKVVYNPEVLRRLQEGVCRFWEPQNWKGEAEVMKYLDGLKKYANKKGGC